MCIVQKQLEQEQEQEYLRAVEKLILERGPIIYSPYLLKCSAEHGHLDILKKIFDLGVKHSASDKEQALLLSLIHGHSEVMEYLVSLGADLDADHERLQYLVEQGKDIEVYVKNI